MPHVLSRRQFLAAGAVAGLGATRFAALARSAPSATVSIAKCGSYGVELVPALDRMFDQLGGLERLVKGRTVGIKLNLTGAPSIRLGSLPAGLAHWVHPSVVGAVVHLMDRAGAQRVRLLESAWATAMPLEEYVYQAGWDAAELVGPSPAELPGVAPAPRSSGSMATVGSPARLHASRPSRRT